MRDRRGNPAAAVKLATPDQRDRAYRALSGDPDVRLLDTHRQHLESRGVNSEVIDARGYFSLPDWRNEGRWNAARRLVQQFDFWQTVPGIISGGRSGALFDLGAPPGVAIPVRDLRGRVIAVLVRPIGGDGPKYLWMTSASEGLIGPSPGAPVHVPQGTLEAVPDRGVLRVTEGILKADVAFALDGVPTIGIPSCHMPDEMVGVLRAVAATSDFREVRLAWDADAGKNPNVARGLQDAVRRLRGLGGELGFDVVLEVWDGAEGKGIDDVLASGSKPRVLRSIQGDDDGVDQVAEHVDGVLMSSGAGDAGDAGDGSGRPEIGESSNGEATRDLIDGLEPQPDAVAALQHLKDVGVIDDLARLEADVGAILVQRAADRLLEDRQQVKQLATAIRKSVKSARNLLSRSRAPQRPIRLQGGELNEILGQCEAALAEDRAEDPIFDLDGGGALCRLRVASPADEDVDDAVPGPAGVHLLDEALTVQRLMRCLDFQEIDAEGFLRTVDCPERIAKHLLARPEYPGIPPLRGFVYAPTLRADGSLLREEGYDSRTGVYADLMGLDFAGVLDAPTRSDALAGIDVLHDLLDEFPYESEIDRAVAVAAILTAIVRPMIDLAPAWAFDAPERSSGKTVHAILPGVIATGRNPMLMTLSKDADDQRKALFSTYLAKKAAVVIDNVEGPLASAVLCMALTQDAISDRLLGKSKTLVVSTRTHMCITGNNLRIVGDLTSRIMPCRLDPGMEYPEDRAFRRPDIVAYALQRREELVAASLAILLAYQQSGERVVPDVSCRFKRWSALVREPLLWLEQPDPIAAAGKIRQEDPERARLADLMEAWGRAFGARPVTARDVVNRGEQDSDLLEALSEVAFDPRSRRIQAKNLGYYLRRYRDRVVDGRVFRSAASDRTKTSVWVLSVEGSIPSVRGELDQTRSEPSPASPAAAASPHRPAGDAGDVSGSSRDGLLDSEVGGRGSTDGLKPLWSGDLGHSGSASASSAKAGQVAYSAGDAPPEGAGPGRASGSQARWASPARGRAEGSDGALEEVEL